MIVGQDWGDVAYFIRNEGFDDLKNRTMQTLERLLRGVGLRISLSAYNTKPIGIRLFLTNAILCLKKGGMTASVDDRWAKNCRTRFLRKQIEIIQPRVVVALGQVAYKSVAMGFDLRAPAGPYRPIVEDKKGIVLSNGSRLFGVYHCAPGVINRTRCFSEQLRDWRRVAKALRE
jgi:hypothetical protein